MLYNVTNCRVPRCTSQRPTVFLEDCILKTYIKSMYQSNTGQTCTLDLPICTVLSKPMTSFRVAHWPSEKQVIDIKNKIIHSVSAVISSKKAWAATVLCHKIHLVRNHSSNWRVCVSNELVVVLPHHFHHRRHRRLLRLVPSLTNLNGFNGTSSMVAHTRNKNHH